MYFCHILFKIHVANLEHWHHLFPFIFIFNSILLFIISFLLVYITQSGLTTNICKCILCYFSVTIQRHTPPTCLYRQVFVLCICEFPWVSIRWQRCNDMPLLCTGVHLFILPLISITLWRVYWSNICTVTYYMKHTTYARHDIKCTINTILDKCYLPLALWCKVTSHKTTLSPSNILCNLYYASILIKY